jgi:hypothetical protein
MIRSGECGLQIRRVIDVGVPESLYRTTTAPIPTDDALHEHGSSIETTTGEFAEDLEDFCRVDIISSSNESDWSSFATLEPREEPASADRAALDQVLSKPIPWAELFAKPTGRATDQLAI